MVTTLRQITQIRRRGGLEFVALTALNALLLGGLLVAGHDAGLSRIPGIVVAHAICALVSFVLCRLLVWPTRRGSFAVEFRRAAIFFGGAGAAATAAVLITDVSRAHGSVGLVLLNYAAVGVVSIAKFGVQRSAMLAVEPA